MKKCLLLIDVQNDYFPGGNMEVVQMVEAAANAALLLEKFREAKLPVIHVQHLSTRQGATFLLPGTFGAEIHQMVAPREGEQIVVKNFPNSFRGTNLLDLLREVDANHLVICGAMSHMCIDSTTRAAFDRGFQCTVADDACATRDLSFDNRVVNSQDVHAAYMAALSAVFAKVVSTRQLLESLD